MQFFRDLSSIRSRMDNWCEITLPRNLLWKDTQWSPLSTDLLWNPAQMFHLHSRLHGLHLVLHPWKKVSDASLYGAVPGLSHGWVFGSQEHGTLSGWWNHLKVPEDRGQRRQMTDIQPSVNVRQIRGGDGHLSLRRSGPSCYLFSVSGGHCFRDTWHIFRGMLRGSFTSAGKGSVVLWGEEGGESHGRAPPGEPELLKKADISLMYFTGLEQEGERAREENMRWKNSGEVVYQDHAK